MTYDLANALDDHLGALEQNATDNRIERALALLAHMETHCPYWLVNIEGAMQALVDRPYEVERESVDSAERGF